MSNFLNHFLNTSYKIIYSKRFKKSNIVNSALLKSSLLFFIYKQNCNGTQQNTYLYYLYKLSLSIKLIYIYIYILIVRKLAFVKPISYTALKINKPNIIFKKTIISNLFNSINKPLVLLTSKWTIMTCVTTTTKYITSFFKRNLNILYLRKVKIFNKGRYSRNRQLYRTGVYWCLYLNIILVVGLYFWFYRFTMNVGYLWWVGYIGLSSIIIPWVLKFNLYKLDSLLQSVDIIFWYFTNINWIFKIKLFFNTLIARFLPKVKPDSYIIILLISSYIFIIHYSDVYACSFLAKLCPWSKHFSLITFLSFYISTTIIMSIIYKYKPKWLNTINFHMIKGKFIKFNRERLIDFTMVFSICILAVHISPEVSCHFLAKLCPWSWRFNLITFLSFYIALILIGYIIYKYKLLLIEQLGLPTIKFLKKRTWVIILLVLTFYIYAIHTWTTLACSFLAQLCPWSVWFDLSTFLIFYIGIIVISIFVYYIYCFTKK